MRRTTLSLLWAVLTAPLLGQQASPPLYTISTLAGSNPSAENVPAMSAYLWRPSGVAVDQGGNVYVAESLANRVIRITPQGVLTTYAGTGQPQASGDGGKAISAGVPYPVALATGKNGTLYIGDATGTRRVTSDGTISTVSHGGQIWALAIDTNGNLYTSSAQLNFGGTQAGFYCSVDKVAPDGTRTLFAGSGCGNTGDAGPATGALIYPPSGIAVDSKGAVYLLNGTNIRQVTTDGVIHTIPLPDSGTSGAERGLGITQNDDLLIANPYNGNVIRRSTAGSITILASSPSVFGSGQNYDQSNTVGPAGVTAGQDGTVYVCDPYNHTVAAISASGSPRTIAGKPHISADTGPAKDAILKNPRHVAADQAGTVYVSDDGNALIKKVDANGIITTIVGNGAKNIDGRNNVDGRSLSLGAIGGMTAGGSTLYFIDQPVRQVGPDDKVTTVPGTEGLAFLITCMTSDTSGALYFNDLLIKQVHKAAAGVMTVVAAASGYQLNGIAADAKGQLYLSDVLQGVVRTLRTDNSVSIIVGGGNKPFVDGMKATDLAGMPLAGSLAVDSRGRVVIAGGSAVYLLDTTGNLWRLAGAGTPGGDWGDGGLASQAPLLDVGSVAVDKNDRILIADAGAGRVRVLTPGAPPFKLLEVYVINSNIGNPTCSYPTLACRQDTFPQGVAQLGLVFRTQYLPANSNYRFRYRRPDGTIASDLASTGNIVFSPQLLFYDWSTVTLDVPGTWAIVLEINGAAVATVPFTVLAPVGPQITSVVNAATYQSGGISPNEFITIKGAGLGPVTGVAVNMSTLAAGTRVFIGGLPAPLTYTQDGQVNALAPWGIKGTTSIQAEYNGVKGNTIALPIVDSSPGIFTQSYGPGQAWVSNQDGTFNNATNPAPRNSYIAFWVTGQGLVDTPQSDGQQPAGPPFPTPLLPVTVTLGGSKIPDENVVFKGLVYSGELQLNIRIPDNAPTGSSVPLILAIGPASSRSDATIAVK